MSDAPSIHRTAEIHPSAEIAPGAIIEAGAYVGPHCVIGRGTRLRPKAMVLQHTLVGEGNDVFPTAVLGGDPQDRKYDPGVPGRLIVGDRNIFREGVTLNRSVGEDKPTRIGSGCFFMACSHAGHNVTVGDNVTLANNAVIGGHGRVDDAVFMSACAMVHQYSRVGEYAMVRGGAAAGTHCPPYLIMRTINEVAGLNRVGLQRSGRFSDDDLRELKEVYRLFFRGGPEGRSTVRGALEEAAQRTWGEAATKFIEFIREVTEAPPPYNRGLPAPYGSRQGRTERMARRPEAIEAD